VYSAREKGISHLGIGFLGLGNNNGVSKKKWRGSSEAAVSLSQGQLRVKFESIHKGYQVHTTSGGRFLDRCDVKP
jgi:hypothetical protein